MTPRPYQRQAIDATWAYLTHRKGNPCIELPTGSGKTIVIAELIREALTRWPGTRICVLAHVRELVAQNADKLARHWPEAPIGVYSAGLNRRDRFEPVIFASIQSVASRAMQLGRFDLLLIDEAHRIPLKGEGQYRQFIDDARRANPQLRIAGLTATPYRLGGGPVCGPQYILNEIAYTAGVGDLIRDGYLCRLVSKTGAARANLAEVGVRNGDYIPGQLERACDRDDVVEAACDEIAELCGARRAWIVFAAGVRHAQHVTEALQRRGVSAAMVDGKTPKGERAAAIERFQRGQLRALVNVNVLSEGFDATHVDAVVLMRPTKSAALYYQQCGRGLRLHDGKPDCLVLDFAGNIVEHGPIDALIPPRRPGEKATSAAPMRECPQCNKLVAIQILQCECGHQWPAPEAKPAHAATASDAAILSEDVEPTVHAVTRVSYSEHVGKSGRPTLQVVYTCGLRTFREWVCLEHGGMPRIKALAWWGARDSNRDGVPKTVAAALPLTHRLIQPTAIAVREVGRYPEITSYEFASTHARAA